MPKPQRKIISGAPLFKKLDTDRGGATAFAKRLEVSEQALSNWRRRGIPAVELPRVAAALNITVEKYLLEAGHTVTTLREPGAQYSIEGQQLLEDYLALPDWLQEHVARKTSELRKYADSLPAMVREGMKGPPKEPERYRAWERQVEDDMIKRGIKSNH